VTLTIAYGGAVVVIPESALCAHGASDADFAVLARLCANKGEFTDIKTLADTVASLCGKSSAEVEASIHFWRGAGIISLSGANIQDASLAAANSAKNAALDTSVKQSDAAIPPEQTAPAANSADYAKKHLQGENRPNYTGIEASRIIESTPGLKVLIDECQNILGKMFNVSDISALIELSDNLRLDNEYIMMLVLWCKSRGKTSVRYIQRTAYSMFDEGVDTLPKLEDYIKVREALSDNVARLRELFGFGGRTLTPRENEYFSRWFVEWQYDFDIVRRAYDITVESTDNHKLSLPYLNKVLQNWHDSGYKTLEEVDAALAAYKTARDDTSVQQSSFDTDEFFELALKRSYEKINGQNDNK